MADSERSGTFDLDEFLGRPKPSRGARVARWLAAALVVALLVALAIRRFDTKPVTEFQSAPVERGDLAMSVTAVGNLAPTSQITIGSQLSGLVTQVRVDVNDHVSAGQTVALIDTRRLDETIRADEAQLAAQNAGVAQQRATVREAQAQLARFREVSRLSGGRVPAQTEMATQEATVARALGALRAAEAQVASARAQLSSDRTQREYAVIRSPVGGVVLSRQIDPGQTVAATFNTPTLFTIAEDLARMKLDVSIDEADVGQVRAGQPASFTVDAFPGREFPATITRVNLGATSSSTTSSSTTTAATTSVVSYIASLTVANEDLSLRPGMTATATIAVGAAHDVLLVPNAALRFALDAGGVPKPGGIKFGPPGAARPTLAQERGIGVGSHQTIQVLDDENRPQPVAVVTGASNGRSTVVTSDTLKAGMRVITGRVAVSK